MFTLSALPTVNPWPNTRPIKRWVEPGERTAPRPSPSLTRGPSVNATHFRGCTVARPLTPMKSTAKTATAWCWPGVTAARVQLCPVEWMDLSLWGVSISAANILCLMRCVALCCICGMIRLTAWSIQGECGHLWFDINNSLCILG